MDFRLNSARKIDAMEISDEERAIRRDLAAAYRLFAHFGYDDLLGTHLSARVPSAEGDAFLINPLGLMFDEITASSLIKVNYAGDVLQETPYAVNRAGHVIHSAVLEGCPHLNSVMHLHTLDGVAVSATKEGLLPLNQTAMAMCGNIAFHEYEGPATSDEEKEHLARDIGDKRLMLLRNHGTLSAGTTVGEAFYRLYNLEWACTVQVKTLSMGRELNEADPKVVESTGRIFSNDPKNMAFFDTYTRDLLWPALLRRLDRVNPGYED